MGKGKTGRPSTLVRPRRIWAHVDGEAVRLILEIARTTGQTKSQVVRQAVYLYLGYRQKPESEGQNTEQPQA